MKKKHSKSSSVDFDTLPSVTIAGLCVFDPIWGQKYHSSGGMEMLFILKGEVKILYDDKSFHGRSGDMLCVPSGTSHLDDFDLDTTLEVFMIQLSWNAEKSFWGNFDNSTVKNFTEFQKTEIARTVELIRSDLDSGSSEEERLIISSRCHTLLLLLMKFSKESRCSSGKKEKLDSGIGKQRQIMLKAKKYIDSHYSEMLSLDKIAESIGISPYYLSHIFSRESNFSLFSYLTTLRMDKAKSLLAEGKMNVSEVADAVGYESGSYFSRVFKHHFGHSPRFALRKSFRTGQSII